MNGVPAHPGNRAAAGAPPVMPMLFVNAQDIADVLSEPEAWQSTLSAINRLVSIRTRRLALQYHPDRHPHATHEQREWLKRQMHALTGAAADYQGAAARALTDTLSLMVATALVPGSPFLALPDGRPLNYDVLADAAGIFDNHLRPPRSPLLLPLHRPRPERRRHKVHRRMPATWMLPLPWIPRYAFSPLCQSCLCISASRLLAAPSPRQPSTAAHAVSFGTLSTGIVGLCLRMI